MTTKIETKIQNSFPAITEWNQQVKWMTETRELSFTPEDIKREFSDNPKVTLKECVKFIQKCISHRLDPYLGDAHLIKFGDYEAKLIVGKYAFIKIAKRSGVYNGCQAGVIVIDKNGKTIKREGSMLYEGEKLVGGWGKVFKKNEDNPDYDEVLVTEYAKRDSKGKINSQWQTMPCTMIRKVGLVHALREAFPELRGMYEESEVEAMRNAAKGEKQTAKSVLNEIFNKKKDEPIDAEFTEITEEKPGDLTPNEKPDVLANELKIYAKALKLSDEKINELFEKYNVSSWEELTDEIKQKCINRLKPQYEALKQTPNKTEEAIKNTFDDDPNPFDN